MTKDEYEAAGLYQCDGCGRLWESERSLVYCCDPRWDRTAYERHWEQD